MKWKLRPPCLLLIGIPSLFAACLNSPDYDYDGQGHGCQWIRNKEERRVDLCQETEVRSQCPQTCGICCENNPDYKFENNLKEMKSCFWLGQQENRQQKYCDTHNNGEMVRNMCPLACDFCQDKVLVPSPSPTPIPTPTQSACLNNPYYSYGNFEGHGCQWIRKEESRRTNLCLKAEVRTQCPQTCGICCENDPDFKFLNVKDVKKSCSWLGEKIRRKLKFCKTYNNNEMVRNMCPLACDFCQESVPVTTVVKAVVKFDLCGSCSKDVESIDTDAIGKVFKGKVVDKGAEQDSVEDSVDIGGSCSQPCADTLLDGNNRPISMFLQQTFNDHTGNTKNTVIVIGFCTTICTTV